MVETSPRETIEHDHQIITKMLDQNRTVSTETMDGDVRFLWRAYLVILESGLSTINH